MKTAVTVGVNEKGELSLLPISQKPFDEQRKHFGSFKTGDLPKGVTKVLFCVAEKQAAGIDRKAQKLRESGALIDADGEAYPPDVHAAREKWRADDNEARVKHETDHKTRGTPYKSKTKIPE